MMNVSVSVVLTRYLYLKNNVQNGLIWAILDQQKEEALFWAYELYHSGFQKETLELLLQFAEIFLQENHATLLTIFHQANAENSTNHESLVGNMVLTLIHHPPSFSHLLRGRPARHIPPSNDVYMTINETDRDMYRTKEALPSKAWKQLRSVLYPSKVTTITDVPQSLLQKLSLLLPVPHHYDRQKFLDTWLYYASFSPIWNKRIADHDGFVDHDTQTVTFDDEDQEEMFCQLYGYEPDEQPLDIQQSLWSFDNPVKTISWSQFCKEYGKHNLLDTNVRIQKR